MLLTKHDMDHILLIFVIVCKVFGKVLVIFVFYASFRGA